MLYSRNGSEMTQLDVKQTQCESRVHGETADAVCYNVECRIDGIDGAFRYSFSKPPEHVLGEYSS